VKRRLLEEYHRKRDFKNTPEPAGNTNEAPKENEPRFVVQKHDATKLHYDFRLETKKEGVLKSWAVPKGVSLNSKVKRLAVLTEDHPLDYLLFEGIIPDGSYGAGTVIVWDTGTYTSEQEISDQFKNGKITFTLVGKKLRGKFSLVKTSRENQWLLIKGNDEFESEEEDLTITRPKSILSGRTNQDLENAKNGKSKNIVEARSNDSSIRKEEEKTIIINIQDKGVSKELPAKIKPMLAIAVDEPFNSKDWVFEVKWDGVRSILFLNKTRGILEIQSRSGKIITHRYPELVKPLTSAIKCKESIVIDGEIVVLDKRGAPSFQNHQSRMNIDHRKEIEILSQKIPATYYIFDILYLDGKNIQNLDFLQRRKILSQVVDKNNKVQISDFIEEIGKEVFDNAKAMNLEGIVAKYKFSKYLQGTRSREWLKIKSIETQDCVVIGYTKGEGNRENYFGSLLLAVYYYNNDSHTVQKLRFVGHTGSGFSFDQLGKIYNKLKEMRIERCPIDYIPYTNQDPIWIEPILVAEVKFNDWTQEKIMRAPIFLRFREDKMASECLVEEEKSTEDIISKDKKQPQQPITPKPSKMHSSNTINAISITASFFSNLDKVFWDKSENHPRLTKKDLIEYYNKISKYLLPCLKSRPLSLSRYPEGIKGNHFYHKNWDQTKPDFVETVKVHSKSKGGIINYIVCNNKDTLLWLANLGCIEMHPWYSRVNDFACENDNNGTAIKQAVYEENCGLNTPDFMVFDLDPYIYSGSEKKRAEKEPEYHVKAFKATVDIAYDLKDLFDELKIKSYIKTSGKTGLHIFVPIEGSYTYDQTKAFAEIIGKILSARHPQKITMAWDTSKRVGKVFFDYNQNAMGKTIASVFSARPTPSATVSMPVSWRELSNLFPTDFTILNAHDIIKKSGNAWNDILQNKQDINKILEGVTEIRI
jgi:bifunctional non-homologous end joining protein LigD